MRSINNCRQDCANFMEIYQNINIKKHNFYAGRGKVVLI